jgi:hypothetical protein
MNKNYNFVPSVLHTTAQQIDVTDDLQAESTKTIAELLHEKEEEEKDPKALSAE